MDEGYLAMVEKELPVLRALISEAMRHRVDCPEWHAAVQTVQDRIDRIPPPILREITNHEKDAIVRGEAALGLIRHAGRENGASPEDKMLTMRWLKQDASFHPDVNRYASEMLEYLEGRYAPWGKVLYDLTKPHADRVLAGKRCIQDAFGKRRLGRLYGIAMDGALPMEVRVEARLRFRELVVACQKGEEDWAEVQGMAANLDRVEELNGHGGQTAVKIRVGSMHAPDLCEFIKRVARERIEAEGACRTSTFRLPPRKK